MPNLDDRAQSWQALVDAINRQPGPARQGSWRKLRSFVHDMRQSLGQVKSAQEILRRLLMESPPRPELIEMLDIIQGASEKASATLAEFTTGLVESIEPE